MYLCEVCKEGTRNSTMRCDRHGGFRFADTAFMRYDGIEYTDEAVRVALLNACG